MRSSSARRVITRRALVTLGAAVLTVPFIANSAFSAPIGARATIAGSVPAWATSSHASGAPASSASVSFHVVLKLRDAAGAEKLAAAVSNPKSATYGRYLTAAAFNAKYAPTSASVAKVEAYLKSSGFSVTGVAAGNRWVEAKGSVGQINAAFGTTLRNYSYKGHTLRGASSNLSVPSSVSSLVMGFSGINQTIATPATAAANVGRTPVQDNAGPADAQPAPANCSAYWDQYEQTMPLAYGKTSFPTPGCGYGPADFRAAYGIQKAADKGNTGTGITVAIVDAYASPSALQDINDISDYWGEPEMAAGQYTETTFGPFDMQDLCGGEEGWNVEQSLDIDAVHGMAPGANIHYFGAKNCDAGLDDALNYIVQNHSANIVSDSWGNLGEDGISDVAIEHSIFLQGALEGIGFYFSTGDDADNVELGGLATPEPDFPSSDPTVTAVGGTTLAVNQDGSYKFETVWGPKLDRVNFATSPSTYNLPLPGDMLVDIGGGQPPLSDGGAGGGVSALFAQPWYQAGIVPNKLAKLNGQKPMRVVPDISMDADPETGMVIDYAGGLYQYGGTSLACPLMAAMQAVASQNRLFPIGFANPLLYTLSLTGVAVHDITNPKSPIGMASRSGKTLFTLGLDSSLTMTKGYDDATGLGSPNGAWFLLGEAILP